MRRAVISLLVFVWSSGAGAQSVYFGTLHAHTSYSDGSGTPAEAYRMARDAGLDFIALTEHNHDGAEGSDRRGIASMPQLYAGQATSLLETANRLNSPGSFVTIYGQEVSTISAGNHINIFGVNSVVDENVVPNGDVPALLAWAQTHSDTMGMFPLLQFNHPHNPERHPEDYGRDDFAAADWVRSVDPFVELIEVLNAPALKDGRGHRAHAKEGYYLAYLNLGFHLGPSVGHDNHFKNWGVSTDARIGVVASALTREAIMTALRGRRTYATEDRNLKVIFRSGSNFAGDVVTAPATGTELPLSVDISDADPAESTARYEIEVLADMPGGDRARRVDTFTLNGNGTRILDGIRLQGPGQFVLLRITQANANQGDAEHREQEDRVWTAPIWFEAAAPSAIVGAAVKIADLLPNPVGDDAQNESVSVINTGVGSVSLNGWQLRDASANIWTLSGAVAPNQRLTFRRAGQPMSLNNDGDVIELVNSAGVVVDSGQYGRASQGQVVTLQRQ